MIMLYQDHAVLGYTMTEVQTIFLMYMKNI